MLPCAPPARSTTGVLKHRSRFLSLKFASSKSCHPSEIRRVSRQNESKDLRLFFGELLTHRTRFAVPCSSERNFCGLGHLQHRLIPHALLPSRANRVDLRSICRTVGTIDDSAASTAAALARIRSSLATGRKTPPRSVRPEIAVSLPYRESHATALHSHLVPDDRQAPNQNTVWFQPSQRRGLDELHRPAALAQSPPSSRPDAHIRTESYPR